MILATKNRPKAAELAALLSAVADPDLDLISLADWEERHQALPEAEEGADSFAANALLKARHYARLTGRPALADDSGLSVAALRGRPGVLSARYGGPGLDDAGRCDFLLENMAGRFDRRAYFTSVLALARPDGRALCWPGEMPGLIAREKRGAQGFGYDPIFYYPPLRKTLAQIPAAEKNKISHRARAARAFLNDARRIRQFLT